MFLEADRVQEIRDGVQRLLASRTFRRSDQLKKLISHLCEGELAHRRSDLNEYHIAVRALGRPTDFSPEEDSSVRTRTHSLRQKLAEYYSGEGAADPVRIELPKGSYIPVFKTLQAPAAAPPPKPPRRGSLIPYIAACSLLLLSAIALAWTFRWIVPGPAWTTQASLQDFWRPMLDSEKPVAICVGQPPHIWVRDYGDLTPPRSQYAPMSDPPPDSESFREWFRNRTGHKPGKNLVLHASPNSPLWGDSAGASAAIRFFAQQALPTDLIPETTLRNSYPLKGRNSLVFAREEFSELVHEIVPADGYRSRYVPEIGRLAIVHDRDPKRIFLNSTAIDQENFGLITVLRPVNKGDMQIVFSGITSDGSLAGIDFLTNAESVERAKSALGGSWPPRFQIVVRTRSINGYPLKPEYAAHHIF